MESSLGLVAAASLLGAMASLHATSYLCALAALVVAVASFAVSRSLRRRDGRGALAWAALPIQVALPALFLAAYAQLSGYLARPPFLMCGSGDLWIPCTVFAWCVGAFVSRLAATAASPPRRLIGPCALRVAACACALGLLGLATRASQRAARLPDSPAAWVASQPLLAEIPPLARAVDARSASSDLRRVGEVCVERRCGPSQTPPYVDCSVRVTSHCGDAPAPQRSERDDVPPEAALRIRSARRLGAWLVEVSSPRGASPDLLAFTGSPPVQRAYDRGDIASELAPPRGWIVGGFVAGALALLLTLASWARRPFDPAGWQEAWHEGGGRLRVGETTTLAAGVASLPVGYVIVRVRRPGGAPFRASAAIDADDVVAGTLHDATACAALDAAAPALLALSSAAALGAPLLLAALLGSA